MFELDPYFISHSTELSGIQRNTLRKYNLFLDTLIGQDKATQQVLCTWSFWQVY